MAGGGEGQALMDEELKEENEKEKEGGRGAALSLTGLVEYSSPMKCKCSAEEKQGRIRRAASVFGAYEEDALYSRQAGLSVVEPWISGFPVKTAEVRAGPSRTPAGILVLLFQCGSRGKHSEVFVSHGLLAVVEAKTLAEELFRRKRK